MTTSITITPYFVDLLAAMRRNRDDEVFFRVEEARPGLHVVEEPDGWRTVVDSRCRMVDDSIEARVPLDFPGRVEPEHCYDVQWIDGMGEPRSTCTEASSPELARLLVNAPPDAYVSEQNGGELEA